MLAVRHRTRNNSTSYSGRSTKNDMNLLNPYYIPMRNILEIFHFTNMETEAQGGQAIYPSPHI